MTINTVRFEELLYTDSGPSFKFLIRYNESLNYRILAYWSGDYSKNLKYLLQKQSTMRIYY